MRTVLLPLITCMLVLPAYAKYSGGTGEPNDPYQIATTADLVALSADANDYSKHFKLMTDIDLSGFDGKEGRPAFNVIGDCHPETNGLTYFIVGTPFRGVFDGNGNTISHLMALKANGDRRAFVGLFGGVARGAEIKNLRVVVDVNVDGGENIIGALAGYNGGTVSQCSSQGTIAGKGLTTVGGLIGWNYAGTVTDCHSVAVVSGGYVGGLLGGNSHRQIGLERLRGYVSRCYSVGRVSGDLYVGGLAGTNEGEVSQCYSAGRVSGNLHVGGLVGGGAGAVIASFWDIQASGQATGAGGTGKISPEMQTAQTFLEAGWDFVGETDNGTEDIWWILEGRDYPRLWWELPADDFEDGEAGPLWFVYAPEPELVQIREVNARLEIAASAQAQNVDAFYVSDGWRLDVTKEFAIRVDFHFSKQNGGDGRVTLGVVPSLEASAMQWAELEAGCFDTRPFYLYEVSDGSWVQERVADRSADGGTLYMSYDPHTDELYFSDTGYGEAHAWQTVTGLLQGRWAGEPVYVILGGGSEGMALTGEDAWLDDLVVSAGTLILSEPVDENGPGD